MPHSRFVLICLFGLLLAVACDRGDGGDSDPPSVTASPATEAAPAAPGAPAPRVSEGDWTMLGYGLSSHYHNPDERAISVDNAAALSVAWERTFSVNGTPAVAGEVVYAVAFGGTYALDAATGNELWFNEGAGGTSSPAYAEGIVYVHDFGSMLHALDAATGEEQWQAPVDEHRLATGFSSPIVAGELVIVGSSSREESVAIDDATFRGGVVAFDRATGDEVWRYYTVEPPFNGASVWSTPTVDLEAGRVFGTTGNNYTGEASDTSDSIFALDLATGDLVWNTQLKEGDVFTIGNPRSEDSDFGTNPILYEMTVDGEVRRLVAAGQKSGVFWALDRDTGEVVWSQQVSNGSALIGGVLNNGAFDGERIIVAGSNGASAAPGGEAASGESEPLGAAAIPTSVLMALDPADGTILWERQLAAWVWAPITLANGVGFVAAESELQAFDTTTGEKLSSFNAEGTISSGPAVAGGRIFFGSGLSYINTTPGNTFRALALP